MFHEVDRALREWLRSGLPADVLVDFAAPSESLVVRATEGGGAVNCFMYEISEQPGRAVGNWVGVRARDGAIVGRQPPIRHYQVFYAVTAWAADAEKEHELLGNVLATIALQDTIPLPCLTGSLRAADRPIPVSVADAGLPGIGAELWSALGAAPRTVLNVVVTVPLVPPMVTDLAPRPERVELGAENRRSAAEPAADADRRSKDLR